jgi:aminopeptidase N
MKRVGNLLIIGCMLAPLFCSAQLLADKNKFTHADTLRGSITQYRKGWDVLKYDLSVTLNIDQHSITGSNIITYHESLPVTTMQIDLQKPMMMDSVVSESGSKIKFRNDGNVWMLSLRPEGAKFKFLPGERKLTIYYHGKPKEAKKAPWDGGLVWKKDSSNNPYVATACQGLGASVWWPCKDHQSDEPDSGMTISISVPDALTAVSNGRLQGVNAVGTGYKEWRWLVKDPINTYGVTMNIGKYINWKDTINGEGGKLDIQFWALEENAAKAKAQFAQAIPMLHCFEDWFGKYPFYKDGYKLVEVPFLGMEHQSAIAYGNKFMNGYLGKDRSNSGYGLEWDYIIIHESGHEWFGNSITTKDIADMWVHEGFTTYSEVLYTECQSGKEAAYDYMYGILSRIENDKPIIGPYGVNKEGSGDMYYKGAAMIHTLRNMIDDDNKFKMLLRKMQATYYHKEVTSAEIENFIAKETGLTLKAFFNQYLRSKKVPELEYSIDKNTNTIRYRLTNVVDQFALPIKVRAGTKRIVLQATSKWKTSKLTKDQLANLSTETIKRNYLVSSRQITSIP